jgi:hypothetical protein
MAKEKRKHTGTHDSLSSSSKKKGKKEKSAVTTAPAVNDDIKSAFRPGLFDSEVLKEYNEQYAKSGPYATLASSAPRTIAD